MKILVVEDDEFLIKIYKMTLVQEGHEVTIAKDGAEGLKALEKGKQEFVILDLLMPKKDGFEFLEEMRQSTKWKKIPVLVLTNLGQDSAMERVKELGIEEYIIKGNIDIESIIKKINKYCKKKKK